jgi:hypothetical protein
LERDYRAALIHLQEAASGSRSEKARAESLRLAREKFIDTAATFVQIDPLRSSWAAVYVSGIGAIEGSSEDRRYWLDYAHSRAVEAVQMRCDAANSHIDGTVGRRLKLTGPKARQGVQTATAAVSAQVFLVAGVAALPVALGGGALLGGAVMYAAHRAAKERANLEELANYVAELRIALGRLGNSSIPKYSLQRDSDLHFQYVKSDVALP